jgi:hypothetical protein
MVTAREICEALRHVGVKAGDHLLVHSSLRAVGPIDGGVDAMVDGLLDAVGPDGTLAMPSFHYTRPLPEPWFDPATTPGKTGWLTEVFRRRPGVLRSLHPAHSVSAIGPRAASFLADHRTSFGILRLATDAAAAVLGHRPCVTTMSKNDAFVLINQAGIPTLAFGPTGRVTGRGAYHQPDEFLTLDEIWAGCHFAHEVVRRWLES